MEQGAKGRRAIKTGENPMRKKIIGFALTAMLFAVCFPAQAQQAQKLPRIGFVSVSGDAKNQGAQVEAGSRLW